jgi:hypothetical protein
VRVLRTPKAWRSLVLAAAGLGAGIPAAANGVDSAGRIVIVPLVVKTPGMESIVTVTNTGPERLFVLGTFFGADGFSSGTVTCHPRELPPSGSFTVAVSAFCPGLKPDSLNMGYLELSSEGDATLNFFATSTMTSGDRSVVSDVAGQPAGAYEAAWAPGLEVRGLRVRASGDETPACYVAALHEPKDLIVDLVDGASRTLGSRLLRLSPRQMLRLHLPSFFGLSRRDRDNLRVRMISPDTAVVVAGCGIEEQTGAIAYLPAQGLMPMNTSRLRLVNVGAQSLPGPYRIAQVWQHTSAGSAMDTKVTLSTYLRPSDNVRCRLQAPFGAAFDPTPWLELQVKAPDGQVWAGGNGAKDTGVFRTEALGRFRAADGQRWHIEVSFDEDAHASAPWPKGEPAGLWSLRCESAAGMSEPLPVDVPPPSDADDF